MTAKPHPAVAPVDLFQKCYAYKRVEEAKAAGLYPYFIPIEGSEGTVVTIGGEQKIMLGSNNYLGLTHDPRVMARAEEVTRHYGTGCTGSRFLNGTLDLHEKLERDLADLVRKEAALVFSTGYFANLGAISSLVGRNDYVIIDKLDHASIVDGCRMAVGETLRFRHNDVADLERVLLKAAHKPCGKLVVVDGIFSMEGDLSRLPEIVPMAKRYGARMMVDEAHSLGVMGPTGAGAAEHFGLSAEVDLLMGTFSKSFASIGGFIAGEARVVSYIKHNARALMFSAALPPYAVATVQTCLDILKAEPERRERLWRNAELMKNGIQSLGFNTGPCESPVIPVIVGPIEGTFVFWKELLERGVFTNPVVPPAVPENSCLIRTSVMASHTEELLARALEIFKAAGKKVGLI
ncbi:MAG: aminotransferase class I/II-fold pyridoxal phosphate-dependent enzyme [Candidatus Eisenbacteria bacterium]|uniref:Aminotransferase class I/II-fold pyridoxal phosphate-dependent enzyme n=1 Tax=Eiseniibacteriota bacterium TaxID=2212470 RepID=A0A937XCY1_UNCEI|nr:aminotransferase class I/II-fold pyridoxal phosphate-dependent enzyme [Candidatus Eisenbacteria bacterium]